MSANFGNGTGALEKAIDLLQAISAAPEGASQAELASLLNLPRTTVYRLLATLVARGMVRRDPLRKVYCLGLRSFEMARQAYSMPDLVAAASVEIRALRDLTGETTYLAARDGLEVLSLDRADGAHSHRSEAVLGKHKPLHCTSQGKAILSALDDATRDGLIKDISLRPKTPLTITDRRRLQAEIRITAARGYAIDDEEMELGIRCVGAPITDSQGKVRGALSVAGPAYRLTRERLDLLGPEVADAAKRVGAQLVVDMPAPAVPDEAVPVPGPWAFHGAFPIWSQDQDCLYWADTLAPAVRVLKDGIDRELARVEGPIHGTALAGDRLFIAHDGGCLLLDAGGQAQAIDLDLPGRIQALCAEPTGRLWMVLEAEDGSFTAGPADMEGRYEALWNLDEASGSLRWDARENLLYMTAPESGSIFILNPANQSIRRFVSMPRGSGQPAGLMLDGRGGLWVALRDGWSVIRFSLDGNVDRVIGMPVPCPTDLALGGTELTTLYVTSARQFVSLDALASAPLSGRLFTVSAS